MKVDKSHLEKVNVLRSSPQRSVSKGLTYRDIPLFEQRVFDEKFTSRDVSFEEIERFISPIRSGFKNARQICAFAGKKLVGRMAYRVSAGRTAFLGKVHFIRGYRKGENEIELVRFAKDESFRKGMRLIQGFARNRREARLLRSSGFEMFARLLQMQRKPKRNDPREPEGKGLEWECYSEKNEAEFVKVLRRTEIGSLDCPRLPRSKETTKPLLGQRMLQNFDPGLWGLARKEGKAIGLLLLNREKGRYINLTYLGVVPEERGKGYGKAFLDRAIYLACGAERKVLNLAVDEENRFALRLYREGGVKRMGRIEGYYVAKDYGRAKLKLTGKTKCLQETPKCHCKERTE